MQREELAAWLRLTLTHGVGNHTARKLLAAFGLPQNVFVQSYISLQHVIDEKQIKGILAEPDSLGSLLDQTLAWLQAPDDGAGQRAVVPLGDARYPASLLTLEDPPVLLYLQGQIDDWCTAVEHQAAIALVGSRNPTPQGVSNATQFAQSLVDAGLIVVSGLALGVDGAAHEGALRCVLAGRPQVVTVAVVGTGLDRVYPRQHHALARRIAQHGVLVSEYPMGTPALAHNFPKRNRIIAGLSQGTLVVEAALQSGSLITAAQALEQGRDVFAIPGSIHSPQSRGCHLLIRQGAKLVESAQDILEELRLPQLHAVDRQRGLEPSADDTPDGPLLQAMGHDPVGLDALSARTGLDTASLQVQLLELELAGHVGRLPGGLYQRVALS